MSIGMLQILDLDFQIISANWQGHKNEDDEWVWTVFVDTEERDLGRLDLWKPSIRGDEAFLKGLEGPHLEGKKIYIPEAYDTARAEWLFTMYVFEHEDVFDHTLEFEKQLEDKINVAWSGKCNIAWDEKYGTDVPFKLEAEFTLSFE